LRKDGRGDRRKITFTRDKSRIMKNKNIDNGKKVERETTQMEVK